MIQHIYFDKSVEKYSLYLITRSCNALPSNRLNNILNSNYHEILVTKDQHENNNIIKNWINSIECVTNKKNYMNLDKNNKNLDKNNINLDKNNMNLDKNSYIIYKHSH